MFRCKGITPSLRREGTRFRKVLALVSDRVSVPQPRSLPATAGELPDVPLEARRAAERDIEQEEGLVSSTGRPEAVPDFVIIATDKAQADAITRLICARVP